jgi:hypothetical protein
VSATLDEILDGIRASKAGREAAEQGKTIADNPHPEESELHWRWLDAWCVENQRARKIPQLP